MHARHRSPGNGYRSNSMGMGMASSRISPEGSVRGHGFYGSEYRNFNRGFGRGQGHPKSFQSPHTQAQPPPPPPPPPPLPPRRGDIFMEAGRLAAEYLVTQGLLPPSALSVKWQNGTLKKPLGEFQEGDGFPLPPEGRASALSRLGSAASDVGMGRRKFGDDFTNKGRRRATSFRGYGSDYSREYRRSGSWSDSRTKSSADVDGDDDTASGHYQEEQQVGKDVTNGVQMSTPSDLAPKNEDAGDSESEFDKYQYQDDTSSKASSSGAGKDLQHENNGEFSRSSDDSKNVSAGIGEENDGNSIDEADKQSAKQDLTIQDNVVEGNPSDKNNTTDLLTLCKFAKVPTRTRSALTHRVPRVDAVPKTELSIAFDMQPPTGSEILVEDASLGDASSNKIHDSKSLDSEVSKAQFLQSAENLVELDSADNIEQGKFATQSFPDGASMHDSEQESSQGLAGFASCSSIAKERGEKRALEDSNMREETKKPRDWIPSLVTKGDEYFHISNSSVKKESLPEDEATPSESMIVVIDHESLKNDSQFPNAGAEQCIDYAQEKQLFPSSYKICDLNLMGASDTNENHDNDPMHIYDPISRNRKEVAPVDVDLSMSNSKVSGGYSRHVTDGKEIEVIDLENDSTTDDKTFHNAERKTETAYTGLEGFSNNAQNTNDIPDVQDGYGLMISELLGGDFPNCSSVPGDISSMHNEMGLPNGEGSLADDDSIYMSLGEIPLSMPDI
ncbi:uncharacterized protein At4g26450 isoform X3 [Quercus lobata]|uniref:uncharacterized protein At4g26450 isoform X3 n=1 Tax=Quercus lobata TaxID=97700 RepID=UPI0012480BFE|nr:uncharacterized protein At4g26450 isoform X3 [Quercus lobata]XP_030929584.1 uncharacterized protein At4g26450 isoform X3 [Quercus lobata]